MYVKLLQFFFKLLSDLGFEMKTGLPESRKVMVGISFLFESLQLFC